MFSKTLKWKLIDPKRLLTFWNSDSRLFCLAQFHIFLCHPWLVQRSIFTLGFVTNMLRKLFLFKIFLALLFLWMISLSDSDKLFVTLQMIVPCFINSDWLQNSLHSWVQRCQSAQTAEIIEMLKEVMPYLRTWFFCLHISACLKHVVLMENEGGNAEIAY